MLLDLGSDNIGATDVRDKSRRKYQKIGAASRLRVFGLGSHQTKGSFGAGVDTQSAIVESILDEPYEPRRFVSDSV